MKTAKMILFAVVMDMVSGTASGGGETVILSTNEWPPFLSESMKHNGVAAHIVREAFAAEGITVRYVFLPWKRAYHEALSGRGLPSRSPMRCPSIPERTPAPARSPSDTIPGP